jgi:hypothetical protein
MTVDKYTFEILFNWHRETEGILVKSLHDRDQHSYAMVMREIESFMRLGTLDVNEFRFEANEISFSRSRKSQLEHWRRFFLVLDLLCLRFVRYDPDYFWYRSEKTLLRRIGRLVKNEPNQKIRSAAWKYIAIPLNKSLKPESEALDERKKRS